MSQEPCRVGLEIDDFEFSTVEPLDVRYYGVPTDVKDFKLSKPLNPVDPSCMERGRVALNRMLGRYIEIFSDDVVSPDPNIESLVEVLDTVLHHDWVGVKSTGLQSLHKPGEAIAHVSRAPVLDIGTRSLIEKVSNHNKDLFQAYDRVGQREDKLVDNNRLLEAHNKKVHYMKEWSDVLVKGALYETVYCGTDFHHVLSTQDGREGAVRFLNQILVGRAYFVFPDPLALTFNGMMSRRESLQFEVICAYPPSDDAIDGALDIKVLGKEYHDPVVKKKTFSLICSRMGLEALFVRADHFVQQAFSNKSDVRFDRLLLQNYCVCIIKRSGVLFDTPSPKLTPYSFKKGGKTPPSSQRDPLPQAAKGMPLPKTAAVSWVAGDVYIAPKQDGENFYGFSRGSCLVISIGNVEVAELKPLDAKTPSFELQFYGERIRVGQGYVFVVFDVFSVNGETGLPFSERWNKFLLLSSSWEKLYPEVRIQQFVRINDPVSAKVIRDAKEGIVLIRGDSAFCRQEIGKHSFYHPVRYLKRLWTVDVKIERENQLSYKWNRCSYDGIGVYEVDKDHVVIRRHPDPYKLPNGVNAIKHLSDACPYEYFEEMHIAILHFSKTSWILEKDSRKFREVFSDPLLHLAWPSSLTYKGFSEAEIAEVERYRGKCHKELNIILAYPAPSIEPKMISPQELVTELGGYQATLRLRLEKALPYENIVKSSPTGSPKRKAEIELFESLDV